MMIKAKESIVGTWRRTLNSIPMEFRFDVEWSFEGVDDMALFASMDGTVEVDGVTPRGGVPIYDGFVKIDYPNGRIVYVFDFIAYGVGYKFEGSKEGIRPWNLPWSHTRVRGSIVDEHSDEFVGHVDARFRLRDLPAFLASFRVA